MIASITGLIGILPPALLVSLSWQRAQLLLNSPDPSRLQDKTKEVDADILISAATYQHAAERMNAAARPLPGTEIRGKQQAVTIYAI